MQLVAILVALAVVALVAVPAGAVVADAAGYHSGSYPQDGTGYQYQGSSSDGGYQSGDHPADGTGYQHR